MLSNIGDKMRNLSIYAANRRSFGKASVMIDFPLQKVQPVYNFTAMDPDSGMAIAALREPVFTAMFVILSGLRFYRIEQLYLFGAKLSRECIPKI